jgi:choline dehydrogenase
MVFARGNPQDFERWQEEGAAGWAYRHVLPYFRRAEQRAEGADEYRGAEGKLQVRCGTLQNPLHRAWLEAGRQAGYAVTADVNGYQQEGIGRLDMSVGDGQRCSTARAYLHPAMRRRNLSVHTQARATRILFDGRSATGIAYRRGGQEFVARARREVLLCCGSINSPQLLKLSGVGPAAELRALGIPLVQDLPGVGENLQDHLEFYFQVACKEPVTLYSSMNPWSKALIGARWLLFKDGVGASNQFETGGFIRSGVGVPYADIQYHFLPAAVSYDGSSLVSEHAFQAHVGPMRSQSRGWVRLASADPQAPPRILFNYMSRDEDWVQMRACVRLTREIFAQQAFDRYRGRELQPGAEVKSDAEIDAFIRERVQTAYHPSCTCKMGSAEDPLAVVDAEARVRGVAALRVVDSSIMPSVTTGNLNAPTIMIAEKASNHILGRPLLPESDAPYHIAVDWRTRQR